MFIWGGTLNLWSKFREIRDAAGAVAVTRFLPIWRQYRAPSLLGLAGLAPFFLTLLAPTGSRALEADLHWEPLQILRRQVGLAPELDARLKVIVVDDGTLKRLRRQPTFEDIAAVTALLEKSGIKRVLVNGFFDLEDGVRTTADTGALPSAVPVITGVAVFPSHARSDRAQQLEPLEPWFLRNTSAENLGGSGATVGMVSASAVLARSAGLGALNSLGAYEAPVAFRSTTGALIPHLSLFAAPWMTLPKDGEGDVPSRLSELLATGNPLFVDFVSYSTLATSMISMRRFFDPNGASVRAALPPDLATSLAGAEIALIVPDAFTGSRTIASPDGQVPSYLAVVSLVNSAIKDRFLEAPVPTSLTQVGVGLAALALALFAPAPIALLVLLAAIISLAMASVALLLRASVLIPALQVGGPLVLVWSRLAWAHFQSTRREKSALRHELATGSIVQKMFIPALKEGVVGPWRYKFLYEPYGVLSGDWLQVSWLRPGVGLIAIGDVVGKGASASLLTASIAALWSDFSRGGQPTVESIGQFIRRLDVFVAETFKGEQNSTLSLALLLEDRALVYAAGAPPWYKVGARTSVSRVVTPADSPLGMQTSTDLPTLVEVPMAEGDALLAFTDGVMDGMAARNRFVKRTQEGLRQVSDEDLFAVLEGEIRSLPVGTAMPDDFTLLMLEYRKVSRNKGAA